MSKRARYRSLLVSTTVLVTLLGVGSSTRIEAAPPAPIDNQDAVELIEAALAAHDRGDEDELDRLLDIAESREVWMPIEALGALLIGDLEDIFAYRDLLDSANDELLEGAAAAAEFELEAWQALSPGQESTADQSADIEDADDDGALILDLIEYRQIEIPPTATLVLKPLDTEDGAVAPTDAVYEQAIDELLQAAAVAADATTAVIPQSPSDGSVADGSVADGSASGVAVDAEPEPADDEAAEAVGGLADEQAPSETTVDTVSENSSESSSESDSANVAELTSVPDRQAEPPTESTSDSMQALTLAAIALAGLALLATLFTAFRGRRHDELADFAFNDSLTGLKNRRRLDADVASHADAVRPTAALMIDVDHFKKFNDTYGHSMGDEVLRLVGLALAKEFRKSDVPYRYGGEEFCVLLRDTTEEEALDAGERVRAAIAAIELPVQERVTASVGVSIGEASLLLDTIGRADGALYSAKEQGRNRVAAA